MSITPPMSPQAQWELALKMPMQSLMGVVRGAAPSQINPAIALAALQQHQRSATAMGGAEAAQQMEQPSVKDRMIADAEQSGIAQLPAENMENVAQAAEGGIVGFDEGGSVFRRMGQMYGTGEKELSRLRGEALDTVLAPYRWLGRGLGQFGEGYTLTQPPDTEKATQDWRKLERAEANRSSPREVAPPASEAAPKPKGETPTKVAGAGAGASTSKGIESLGAYSPTTIPEYPTAKVQTPEEYAAQLRSLGATMGEINSPEQKAIMEAFEKQRARTEGEASDRKRQAQGYAMAKAAQALLQPGQPTATAVGNAFGVAGEEARTYNKDERAINDKLENARLMEAQAKLAIKDGNTKMAMSFLEQRDKNMLKADELNLHSAMGRTDQILKDAGLKVADRGHVLNYMSSREMAEARRAALSSGGSSEKLTIMALNYAGQRIVAERKQVVDDISMSPAARRQRLAELDNELAGVKKALEKFGGIEGESTGGVRTSRQIPDAAVNPELIVQ